MFGFRVSHTIDAERLAAKYKKAYTTLVRDTGRAVQSAIVSNLSISASLGVSSAVGQPPHMHSGALAGSVRLNESGLHTHLAVQVIVDSAYGRIQEYGGFIVAKDKKLAVPLNAEAHAISQTGQSLRAFSDLQMIYVKGRAYLVRKTGRSGGMVFMFVLVDQVYIPPRPFVRPAVRAVKGQLGTGSLIGIT